MRILHLIHQFLPYGIGGSEIYTYELAQEQQKEHEVCIFTAWRNPDLPEYSIHHDTYKGIPVVRLVNNYRKVTSFREGYDHSQIDAKFEEFVTSFKPDVVHIQHLSNLSFGIVRMLKKMGIPTIMTLHDFWVVCPRGQRLRPTLERCAEIDLSRCAKCIQPWLGGFRYPDEDHEKYVRERYNSALDVLNQIDLLISPSLFLKKEFVRLGISPGKILYLENGRETKKFENFVKTPNGGKRFGYIGTLIPSKGVHVLLSAWRNFNDESATLQIYGVEVPYDGWENYGKELKELSAGDPRVQWKGGYQPEELPKILSKIDTLIIPSIWYENAPMTLQEAQLSHTWVIASRIGGIPEKVISGKNSFLFDLGDPNNLLNQLNFSISNEMIKQNSNILVTPIQKHAEQLEGWYRKVFVCLS